MLRLCITTTMRLYATHLGVPPLAFSMCGNIAVGKDAVCLSHNTGGHSAITLLECCVVFVFKSVPLATVNSKNSNKKLSQGINTSNFILLCHTLQRQPLILAQAQVAISPYML